MSEKKKVKFNIIDLIVIVVILAVAFFVGSKLLGGSDVIGTSSDDTYIMTYYFEEVPSFAAEMIQKDGAVSDETKNVALGKVVDFEIGDSIVYAANDEGIMIKTSKEGYNSVKLTTELSAEAFEHGIKVNNVKYVVGHTMTVYAANAKLYGRISGIEKK